MQTFPDWFEFEGNETQKYNQIGNAVPPYLAYQFAQSVKDCYALGELYSVEEIMDQDYSPNNVLTLF